MSVERQWFVAEVLAAVDAIGGAPVVAAGHSLGGGMLLRAEQLHPGTVRACWAFEPVLIPDTWDTSPPPSGLVEASRRRRLVFASVQEAVDRFRSKPPFDRCEEDAVRAYVELGTTPLPDGTVRLTCTGETEANVYETNERLDFTAFTAITCPVVVAAGAAVAMGNELPPMVAPLIADGGRRRPPRRARRRDALRADGGRRARRPLDPRSPRRRALTVSTSRGRVRRTTRPVRPPGPGSSIHGACPAPASSSSCAPGDLGDEGPGDRGAAHRVVGAPEEQRRRLDADAATTRRAASCRRTPATW